MKLKQEISQFKSEHGLDFECAPYPYSIDIANEWYCFRVGTCEGLWCVKDESYDILAITNKEQGNGHFNDVLQWFEQSCKRDGRSLRILEVWNERFKAHLIDKRGFKDLGNNNLVKTFI